MSCAVVALTKKADEDEGLQVARAIGSQNQDTLPEGDLLEELPFLYSRLFVSSLSLSEHQSDPIVRLQPSGLDKSLHPDFDELEVTHRLDPPVADPSYGQSNDLRLPIEVWLRIFGYAAFTSQKSLAYATTLCSGLRGAAEEALYQFPAIHSIWAAQRFASTIRQLPHRAQLVRGLRVGCADKQIATYRCVLHEIFPELKRLHTLDVTGLGDVCVAERTITKILEDTEGLPVRLPSLRRIRGLPIYLSPRLLLLLHAYPHLEELHVYRYSSVPDVDSGSESDYEDELESVEIAKVHPRLRALSCQSSLLAGMTIVGNITSLSLSDVNRAGMDQVARLFGPQLVTLRVERQFKQYRGMAYPTNWEYWSRFERLRFLDVQDSGVRRGDIQDEAIKAEHLPASLDTLIWSPTWVMDCALFDSRSEEWRRSQIRMFAETILRRSPGVKTMVYRWRNDKSYQCVLVGGREDGRYCEGPAEPGLADNYAWANRR